MNKEESKLNRQSILNSLIIMNQALIWESLIITNKIKF